MRFIATATVTISVHTVIEADSKEEAFNEAESRDFCSLVAPGQMGDSDSSVWVRSGEIDGAVENLAVDADEGV